jgi:hypothetical protein
MGVTSGKNPNWYLRVKTLSEDYLVDVGPDPQRARAALENAKRLMHETGAVTIGDALVVNASDIESIALQDADASAAPVIQPAQTTPGVTPTQSLEPEGWFDQVKGDPKP